MRNQHQNDFIDLLGELTQHILQAQAVVDFLSVDIGENEEFSASRNTVSGMLWTVQTLLSNAESVSDKLSKWNKQGGQR